jgi:hypothetical protein
VPPAAILASVVICVGFAAGTNYSKESKFRRLNAAKDDVAVGASSAWGQGSGLGVSGFTVFCWLAVGGAAAGLTTRQLLVLDGARVFQGVGSDGVLARVARLLGTPATAADRAGLHCGRAPMQRAKSPPPALGNAAQQHPALGPLHTDAPPPPPPPPRARNQVPFIRVTLRQS